MGHLDLRISESKDPGDGKDAGTKDGIASQPSATSPKKEDAEEGSLDKASDVLNRGAGDGASAD